MPWKPKGFRKTNPQSEPETNLKCEVCQKKIILTRHMDSNDKDGNWICHKSSYQTHTMSNLRSHKSVSIPGQTLIS